MHACVHTCMYMHAGTHTHAHTHSSPPPFLITLHALPPLSLLVISVASDPHSFPKPLGSITSSLTPPLWGAATWTSLEPILHFITNSSLVAPLPRPVAGIFTYLLSCFQTPEQNAKASFQLQLKCHFSKPSFHALHCLPHINIPARVSVFLYLTLCDPSIIFYTGGQPH